MNSPGELIEMYRSGLLTRGELVNKLLDLASDRQPADYMQELPGDLIDAIRNHHYVKAPPETANDIFVLRGGEEERERSLAIFRRLHAYFYRQGATGDGA